jgi:multidrug resistance efflux pump
MGDIRTTDGEQPPATIKEKRYRRSLFLAALFCGVSVITVLGFVITVRRHFLATGYVTTIDYAEVRPPATGQVKEICVSSGKTVAQGDVLVRLDDAQEAAAFAEAGTVVRRAEADLNRRRAELADARRQHEWDIADARYRLDDLRQAIQRVQAALAGSDTPTTPTTELTVEFTTLALARTEARRAQAQLTRRETEIAETRNQRQWQLAQARLMLESARGIAARTAQLVEAKLAAGSALEDAQLKAQLAEAALKALESQEEAIYDQELAVLRLEVTARNEALQQAEARLRLRLSDLHAQEKLADLRLQALLSRDLAAYDLELAGKEQELVAAKEAQARAQARLDARQIRAPIAGRVLRYEFVLGELVSPETVLMEIFGGDRQVLKLRVPERYATRVAAGQPYRAELAAFRSVRTVYFRGEIEALRSVIQSEGQDTYRVAYCSFTSGEHDVPPGTTAEARVYYGRSCLWLYFFGLD